MIRYGTIEVPRAAVAQLACELGRNGKGTRLLGAQLGWAIDSHRESFDIPKENFGEVLKIVERDGIVD